MKIRTETMVFDDARLSSTIEQTAEHILLQVSEGYATKAQLTITSQQILSEVSDDYYNKTQIDQTASSITGLITDETTNRTTLIRAHSGGVITAYQGQTYGVYTNASGSVDIVSLTWSGTTPAIAATLASYGTSITLGQVANSTTRVVITSSEMEIISRGSGGADTSIALFGSTMRIGADANGYSRVVVQTSGIDFIKKSTSDVILAHIGYDSGQTETGGTSDAPYYSFGSRTGTVGNYSFAEGKAITAAGAYSHAEGFYTQALGPHDHAEGSYTIANGPIKGVTAVAYSGCAHAEGYASEATGESSHAEGWVTKAKGDASHTSGQWTIAGSRDQTVIGRYNIEDTNSTYVFIAGNGSSSTRTNAFTIDWSGNVKYAGTISQMSDRRLKQHKSYLGDDAVNFIKKLKPAYYEKDDELHLGFYAQDVEEIDTWNTFIGEMNGYKTLKYNDFIAPLVAYCQHLEKRIKVLER